MIIKEEDIKSVVLGSDSWDEFCEEILNFQNEYFKVVACIKDLPWPNIGYEVAKFVVENKAEFGIVCCWTGTGVSIAANKIKGARAALCFDTGTAEGARRYNDANILALSQRSIGKGLKFEIIETFLTTDPDLEELKNINLLNGI